MSELEVNVNVYNDLKSQERYMTAPISSNNNCFDEVIQFSKYFESFEFKFNELYNEFKLINPKDIHNFILLNDDLFDYLEKIIILLHTYFNDREYYLEFSLDPEIQNLSQLILYVKSGESSFDRDWDLLRNLNKEIRHIGEFPSTLKKLISVDLW
ncbi:hypothetical protein [uncultured Methanobrevibacter sp.]|uniref:hypothetical protein n=1 Tax=uncultured Methanobrevibacter sp. TaxID=253161 RepID=UPI00320A5F20